METKYIRFTIEDLAKHFLFYLLMVVLFGGTGFLMMVELIELPSSSKVKGIALLITLIPLFFFGFSTFDFITKVISMFRYAMVISARGITFMGEKEIPWTDIKTVQYHYEDGLDRDDCLFLEYNSGETKLVDISGTDICHEATTYRAEILHILSSCILTENKLETSTKGV